MLQLGLIRFSLANLFSKNSKSLDNYTSSRGDTNVSLLSTFKGTRIAYVAYVAFVSCFAR